MATARKAAKKKSRRTVLYSSAGKKLYAVRDASGKFEDIQQYARAHAMDIKRGSTAEEKAAEVQAARTTAKKTTTKKTAATKTAAKTVARGPSKAKRAAAKVVGSLKRALKKVTG